MTKLPTNEIVRNALAIAIEPTFFNLERYPLEPKQVVAMAARCHANTLRVGMFSHQGHAYYPSKIAPHGPGLNNRDLLKEFQQACDKAGLTLVVYMNSKWDTQRYVEHPDWAIRHGGKVRAHDGPNADLHIYPMCPNSPYLDYFASLLREVAERYAPKAIYIDNFGISLGCECRFCAEAFHQASGQEQPPTMNWRDPAWQTYRHWSRERNFVLARRLVEAIRSAKPETVVVFNLGGFRSQVGLINPEGVYEFAHKIADGAHAESAVRFYGHSFAHINEQCMLARACETPLWTWVEYPLLPWSYVSAPPAEVKIKAAKVLANGGRPMVWSVTRSPDGDERGLAGIAEVFGLVKRHPQYFNDTEHVPFLAVLYSSQTIDKYCRGERVPFEESQKEFSGALSLARHNHLPTDILLEEDLARERLSGYKALILPNCAVLSEGQCAEIRAYVQAGGGLIATFESSLYTENGKRRDDFGLKDVIGASFGKELVRQDDHWSTGYSVVDLKHPVTATFDVGFRLPAGDRYLGVKEVSDRGGSAFGGGAAVRLSTMLTRCRYYCDYPGRPTEFPGLLVNDFGRGRVLYLPGQFGLTYAQRGFPDYRRLIYNAVEWMTRGEVLVETSLPDTVEVTLARTARGALVLHLVNCSADLSRPVERVAPASGATIRIRLSDCVQRRARALVAGVELSCRTENEVMNIALPTLSEYEVVVIERMD